MSGAKPISPKLAQTSAVTKVSPGRIDGSKAGATGLIPELDRLVAAKPNARVAIVQGSFDWFHSGHLALVEGVARKGVDRGKPFDAIVVIPSRPHDYGSKSYLVTSYDRRIETAKTALESAQLDTPVFVSDASRRTKAKPAQLIEAITDGYPGLQLSYCLGADSVGLSEKWPGFQAALTKSGVELLGLPRPGYSSAEELSSHSMDPVQISSSEIRRALAEGDVRELRGRVPESTYKALEAQVRSDRARQRAGAEAVGLPRRSDIPFAKIRTEVPRGAIDVLDFIEEKDLSDEMRNHLAGVQRLINQRAQELANAQFTTSKQQLDKRAGQTDKTVLESRVGMHLAGRVLHKQLDPEMAAKVEFITVLSNVLGMPTSLALRHTADLDGKKATGVSIRLVEDVTSSIQIYDDLPKLDEKAVEYAFVSRWFNELIGNLDCWWAQFLTPSAEKSRHSDLIQIDLDGAFDRMPADVVYDKLINHFKRPKDLVKPDGRICQKLDRPYELGAEPTWQPNQLDGEYSLFGYLIRDYVTGKVDVDLDKIKQMVAFSKDVPDAAIQNAMQRWFESASEKSETGEAMVHLPAADPPWVSRSDFERLFVGKLRRSVDGFSRFLDQLEKARGDANHPMRQFYENMPARVF